MDQDLLNQVFKEAIKFLKLQYFLSKIKKFKFLNVKQNKRKFINMLKKNQINKIDIINIYPPFFRFNKRFKKF